jgi:hypothetical protein
VASHEYSLRLEEINFHYPASARFWDATQKQEVVVPLFPYLVLVRERIVFQSEREIERFVVVAVYGRTDRWEVFAKENFQKYLEQSQMFVSYFFWEGGIDRRLFSSEVPECPFALLLELVNFSSGAEHSTTAAA